MRPVRLLLHIGKLRPKTSQQAIFSLERGKSFRIVDDNCPLQARLGTIGRISFFSSGRIFKSPDNFLLYASGTHVDKRLIRR
jgi:hypothetical protein